MDYTRFFLAGGGDLEQEWVYLSSLGLKIDYFQLRLMPLRKRIKLMKIANEVEEAKLKLAENIGPMAMFLGG